mgnify:CR=1 FL=1
MFKILLLKIGNETNGQDSIWLPALVETEECPLPIYVTVNTDRMADMTEEEWINQYKERSGCDKKYPEEIKFSNVIP